MRVMVIEIFLPGAAKAVYDRYREQGRMLPPGLRYIDSWISDDLGRCFQLMECDDRALLDVWAAKWAGLVSFEFVPVIDSAEAARRAANK